MFFSKGILPLLAMAAGSASAIQHAGANITGAHPSCFDGVASDLLGAADFVHVGGMGNDFAFRLTLALQEEVPGVVMSVKLEEEPVDPVVQSLIIEGTGTAGTIFFPPEAANNLVPTLNLIQNNGWESGLVFGPTKTFNQIQNAINIMINNDNFPVPDIILLTGADPSNPNDPVLVKAELVRAEMNSVQISSLLAIDEVTHDNIQKVANAGADMVIAPGDIFEGHGTSAEYQEYFDIMRSTVPE